MSAQPHDFNERNEWSKKAKQEAFWEAVYQQAFPSIVKCEFITDLVHQRNGVDRLLTLSNGITLTVDEKARDRFDTGDILLEYLSNDRTGAPGWIEKDATIDYLAVGFVPSKRCYLFDWRMLRQAWFKHKDAWMVQYRLPPADNRTYKTWSVAVPIKVLQSAMLNAMIIDL